jgi:UDP-N-acetylmuramate dehydrogenase
MILIKENVSLKPLTSMYVGGCARYFCNVKSVNEIIEVLKFARRKKLPHFILGGGCNIIVSDKGFAGIVMRICILGITLIKETDKYADYQIGAGENWDGFVGFVINRGLHGVENLSRVPGSVGGSIVQNIGCYGQEVSSSVLQVEVFDVATFKTIILKNKNLKFSYRKSCLNDPKLNKDKYIITRVVFRLRKQAQFNLQYADLKKYFEENPGVKPSLKTIRSAIISIRDRKFPFPNKPKNGTAGSFWKAAIIDDITYNQIISKLKSKGFENKALEMINKKSVFTVAQGFKLACGLFVEVLGFKGEQRGGAKVLETHCGIINNFTGNATSRDIMELSREVTAGVEKEFGIKMEIEPELVGDFN